MIDSILIDTILNDTILNKTVLIDTILIDRNVEYIGKLLTELKISIERYEKFLIDNKKYHLK